MDDHRTRVEAAYAHCQDLARRHYENFPVASRFLPARLRRPVAAIYAFARQADDIADEGALPAAERHARLSDYRARLDAIAAGETVTDPVFLALADTIARHALPVSLFHDLLSAFEQDIDTRRYASFAEVQDYCRRSANPVGRLLLHLYDRATPANLAHSDCICTALQLINFLQDLAQDMDENDRLYIPLDEMQAHGVREDDFRRRRTTPAMRALIAAQIARAATLLEQGRPLGRALPGRAGLEMRLIIAGGTRILQRLQAQSEDVFSRPRLGRLDKLRLLLQALFYRARPARGVGGLTDLR